MNFSLTELAAKVEGVVAGDGSILISFISPIDNIEPGSLVFADGKENFKKAEASDCAAILCPVNLNSELKAIIQVKQPLQSFIQLLQLFYPPIVPKPGVHPTAVIANDVVLGKNVSIGPYVVIDAGSSIGDNCIIKSHVHIGSQVTIGEDSVVHPQVTVYAQSVIGARVIIHASSVIGSDGFGYSFVNGQHLKIPHVGCVIIEDDVEIGANTAIDRATLGATHIGTGSKIDNLVQVAHSVKLGKHNILCAFTGIAGSTTSGDHVIFAANVGVSDHVTIDDGVILAARAGVPPKKHLLKGNIYLGNPARPKEKTLSQELSLTRIPFMRKNLKNLGEKVDHIIKRIDALEDN